jgi:hypothetical protein
LTGGGQQAGGASGCIGITSIVADSDGDAWLQPWRPEYSQLHSHTSL